MPTSPQESGRDHLSKDILRLVDSTLPYEDMKPGRVLIIHSQDGVTYDQSSFTLRVLSVRSLEENRDLKTATFQYEGEEGDFNFTDGNDPEQTAKLKPGTLMENGISARLLPQTDYHMVYAGGIGVGRDHSFEYVNGEDSSVIAPRISKIEVYEAPPGYKPPDLSGHLQKIKETEKRKHEDEARRIDEINSMVMEDLQAMYGDHPDYDRIRKLIAGYSPNGKLHMDAFFLFAREDGVLDQAWKAFQRAHEEQFSNYPPFIRGDININASNRAAFAKMLQEAGVQWPRPPKDQK